MLWVSLHFVKHEGAVMCYNVFVRIFLISFLITIATTDTAFAYINPGSGSLLLQMLFAGFIGGLFYFRKYSAFLLSFFRRGKKREQHKPSE